MTLVNLAILLLAAFRLSNMLADVEQGGPWDVLSKIRYALGVRFDETNSPYGENTFSRGLLCIYCNSVWVGILLTLLYMADSNIAVMLSLPFALSAFAIITELR